MSGAWPLHDKTHWYSDWNLTISWQNRLVLGLGFDDFMTKHTDTMSRAWPFHDKQTDAISGAWPFHDKQTDAMFGAWPFHEKTDWHYIWDLTISWKNRLILYLGFANFTNYKTYWYFVWGLIISWQKRLTLYLGIDHFMKKQTDSLSGLCQFH
jgi:hypothetical protein